MVDLERERDDSETTQLFPALRPVLSAPAAPLTAPSQHKALPSQPLVVRIPAAQKDLQRDENESSKPADLGNSASTDCSAMTLPTISTLTAATPLSMSTLSTPPYRRYRPAAMHALREHTHSAAPSHNSVSQPVPQHTNTATHASATHNAGTHVDSTASAAQQSQVASSHEIFAGDLSFFCKEFDLYDLFSRFGYVLKTRIKRSEKDGRTLMYGFVVMQRLEDAQRAVNALNGFRFLGRDMRVELSKSKDIQPHRKKSAEFQIHVAFTSYFPHDNVIQPRETLLRTVFEIAGHVKDIGIKEYYVYPNMNKQEGFCFVTFFSMEDARRAVDAVNRKVFHGFIFSCSLSYHNPVNNGAGAHCEPVYAGHSAALSDTNSISDHAHYLHGEFDYHQSFINAFCDRSFGAQSPPTLIHPSFLVHPAGPPAPQPALTSLPLHPHLLYSAPSQGSFPCVGREFVGMSAYPPPMPMSPPMQPYALPMPYGVPSAMHSAPVHPQHGHPHMHAPHAVMYDVGDVYSMRLHGNKPRGPH